MARALRRPWRNDPRQGAASLPGARLVVLELGLHVGRLRRRGDDLGRGRRGRAGAKTGKDGAGDNCAKGLGHRQALLLSAGARLAAGRPSGKPDCNLFFASCGKLDRVTPPALHAMSRGCHAAGARDRARSSSTGPKFVALSRFARTKASSREYRNVSGCLATQRSPDAREAKKKTKWQNFAITLAAPSSKTLASG